MSRSIFGNSKNSSKNLHFFSIAPEFGMYDFKLDQTYHYTSYQLCLQTAAQELGHKFSIVVPATCTMESPCVIPLLSPPSSCGLSSDITALIDSLYLDESVESVAILLYEGSLALAEEFSVLAKRFPAISFVINLFLSEPYFNLDETFNWHLNPVNMGIASKVPPTFQIFDQSERQEQVANLVILTETERKGFVARLLGINSIKRWHTFSAISNVYSAVSDQKNSGSKYRVLVPLSSWQLSEELVNDMISVKKETDMLGSQNNRMEFHLTGYLPHHEVQHLLKRLSGAGFEITSESRSKEDYAEMISSHDVVWLPNRYYILQSSGKALDALVQGKPIIAPLETFGWREQTRWVTGAPGYLTTEEARDIFVNLQFILPIISFELNRQNDSIRSYYSPLKTILSLVSAIEY